MKKLHLLPLAAALVLAGCASNETAKSGTVKQSEIYQSYNITWDGDSQDYSAAATFRFGGENGTTLSLSDGSSVTVNGTEMNEGKMLFGGAYYNFEDKLYNPKNTFRFTDTDKKTFENGSPFEAIEFAEKITSVAADAPFEIAISRDVKPNEKIMLTVEDTSNTMSAQVTVLPSDMTNPSVVYDPAKKKITVSPSFFGTMANVPLKLTLGYSISGQPLKQDEGKGGSYSFGYTSKSLTITRRGVPSPVR